MYKVLLVDDEPLFTDFLQNIIDWHAAGCTLCGIAADGEQALALALLHRPDIVLLDINIPLMNGLEVCRRMREEGLACDVVIVSAHNDFQFAKRAIQYEVSDYLLKPFDKAELLHALQNCFSNVRTHRCAALRAQLHGKQKPQQKTVVALVRKKADEAKLQALAQEVETLCHTQGGDCSYCVEAGQITFAFAAQQTDDAQALAQFLLPFAQREEVSVALGDVCGSAAESHAHAQQALENRALAKHSVVCYENLTQKPGGAVFSQSDLTRLIGCLNNRDTKGVSALIAKLFGLEGAHGISFQYFLSVLSSLTLHMAQHFGKSRADAEKLLAQQGSVMRDIADAPDIEAVAAAIENYIYELYSDCLTLAPVTRRTELVDKINRYIEKNYAQKGFTVEKMAAELLFENSYVRRVYKTETNNTILKALEDYRIGEARRLLAQRRFRHSEIAELTGFGDPYYFSKRFKQIVGCTPSEYEVLTKHEQETNG